jgi:endonuclease-3
VTKVAVTESPYQVLVSCLLSLRTTDKITDKVTRELFKIAKTPRQMAKLTTKQIEKAVHSVNFNRTKAKRIKQISKEIVKKHNGKVPDDFFELLKFKGVGRKTANIVMVYGFGKEGLPVDVHVHVVSNRLGWVNTKTSEKTEIELRKMLPRRYWLDINDLLVRFGQNICITRNPKCNICSLSKFCKYYKEYVK